MIARRIGIVVLGTVLVGCPRKRPVDEELVPAPGQTYPIGSSGTTVDEIILQLTQGDRFGPRGDDTLELRLPGDFATSCQLDRSSLLVRFERDADALRGTIEHIDALAECLRTRFPDARVVVLAPALTDELGSQRAKRVAEALQRQGVEAARLSTR